MKIKLGLIYAVLFIIGYLSLAATSMLGINLLNEIIIFAVISVIGVVIVINTIMIEKRIDELEGKSYKANNTAAEEEVKEETPVGLKYEDVAQRILSKIQQGNSYPDILSSFLKAGFDEGYLQYIISRMVNDGLLKLDEEEAVEDKPPEPPTLKKKKTKA